MTRHFLYLLGIPGAGKTTLLARALDGIPYTQETKPFAHMVYGMGAQLGAKREQFSGTDALAMDAQPKVLRWLETCPYTALAAEGDRLANQAFFLGIMRAGYKLTILLLDTPPIQADRRRKLRGAQQNDPWVKGRISKIRNLVPYVNERLDGAKPLPDLVAELQRQEVIRVIRGD